MNGDRVAGVLSIDELARVTGVPVRNIREYQGRGVLSPPQREGRRAHYNDDHVVRLKLITRMLARGYTLAVIRDLLDVWAGGRELEELLGLEAAVDRSWGAGERVDLTREQLGEVFGQELSDADVECLIAAEAVIPTGDRYNCSRDKLVETVPLLVEAGIPLETTMRALTVIRGHMDDIAEELVRIGSVALAPAGVVPPNVDLPTLTASIDRLRAAAEIVTSGIFGLAMNRAVDAVLPLLIGTALDQRSTPGTARGESAGSGEHTGTG